MALPPSIAPDAAVDLQLHTTYSDGSWTATQLLDYVARERFAVVAVTDHDRTDTVPEVQRLGAERGVRVLAAAELSARWEGRLLDLLCFGFSPDPSPLASITRDTWRRQRALCQRVYATLLRQGFAFPQAGAILADREGEVRNIGDLVTLLEVHGHPDDAYALLEGAGYRQVTADPASLVEAARQSGAVCVIAHPARGGAWCAFDPDSLDRLRMVVPIDGLETRHPSHSPEAVATLDAYAAAHDLLTSTGSDSHGRPE